MTQSISYVVPGRPSTWQRTNAVAGKYVTDRAQRAAKRSHLLCAMAALGPRRSTWDLAGAFVVDVRGFYPSAVVGDCDRLVSLPLDALEGLLFVTDRQVRRVTGEIVSDGSPPRTEVTVTRMESDPVQRKTRAK